MPKTFNYQLKALTCSQVPVPSLPHCLEISLDLLLQNSQHRKTQFDLFTLKPQTMRLSDFILLDADEKKTTVLHEGVLVGKRDRQQWKVFLFRMNDYYVETYCNKQNKAVEEYRVFDHTSLLQTYLNDIPLDDLLN